MMYIKVNTADNTLVDGNFTGFDPEAGYLIVEVSPIKVEYFNFSNWEYDSSVTPHPFRDITPDPEDPPDPPEQTYHYEVKSSNGKIINMHNTLFVPDAGYSHVESSQHIPYYDWHKYRWNFTSSEFDYINGKKYKFYKYLDRGNPKYRPDRPPKDVNYITEVTQKLYPKRVFDKGSLVNVKYYESHDNDTDTFTDEVLNVDVDYVIGSDDYVKSRTTTRKWIYEDGTYPDDEEEWKVTEKHYPLKDARQEGKKRRTNIIDQVVIDVVGLIMQTESVTQDVAEQMGGAFFKEFDDKVYLYINIHSDDLDNEVLDNENLTTHSWLDNDIGGGTELRNYVSSKLNY